MVEGKLWAAAEACVDAIGAIETRNGKANAHGGGRGYRDAEAAAQHRAADHRTTDRKRVQDSMGTRNPCGTLR